MHLGLFPSQSSLCKDAVPIIPTQSRKQSIPVIPTSYKSFRRMRSYCSLHEVLVHCEDQPSAFQLPIALSSVYKPYISIQTTTSETARNNGQRNSPSRLRPRSPPSPRSRTRAHLQQQNPRLRHTSQQRQSNPSARKEPVVSLPQPPKTHSSHLCALLTSRKQQRRKRERLR